jgi:hypothetical protein
MNCRVAEHTVRRSYGLPETCHFAGATTFTADCSVKGNKKAKGYRCDRDISTQSSRRSEWSWIALTECCNIITDQDRRSTPVGRTVSRRTSYFTWKRLTWDVPDDSGVPDTIRKMSAESISETSVIFRQTTRFNIPEVTFKRNTVTFLEKIIAHCNNSAL